MLDIRSQIVLRSINKQCSSGSFQVVEISDLIQSMPKQYKADANLISQCVHELERCGYIEVKYSDSEVFCVCPLPKGRMEFENDIEQINQQNKKKIRLFWIVCGIFILQIISTFLGCLLFRFIIGG